MKVRHPVWVSLADSIVEVDPFRGEVIRRIDTGPVDAISAGAGLEGSPPTG